jgi:hypothetical protein
MKTTLIVSASLLSFVFLGGCSFAARSPDMYRDDTGKELAKKNDDIRACYDGVLKTTPGAAGKVTVRFDVQKDGEEGAGKIMNVQVDKAGTTAPDPVAECVTKNIQGVAISPPDKRLGQGSWAWEFTAPPPPPTSSMGHGKS